MQKLGLIITRITALNMANKLKITGEREIARNLGKEIAKIEGDISKGLRSAAIFVQGESMETTPVSQKGGKLLGSAFSAVGKIGGMIMARVGYTASYAAFVHEMPAENNFTKPGTGPKFLENAVVRNTSTILAIIVKRAKR